MALGLHRTHVTIGRAAEFFDANELEKQTGQPRARFAAMALKELVDNALDAAETTGVPPEITIEASTDGIDLRLSVSDNGPGLPAEVLSRILDFETRTSDKLAYRAPTRGLQGNAMKTIVGLPRALDGEAPLVIETGGHRHEIRARVNPAGQAEVDLISSVRPTPTGTTVSLEIPRQSQGFDAVPWARAFALLNPHACVSVKTRGFAGGSYVAHFADLPAVETDDSYQTLVSPDSWRKWLPSDPTSPHWYDATALQLLIYGLKPAPLLRNFVRQFDGLTGTRKAKAITDRFPGIKRIDELADDLPAVAALLAAMKDEARLVRPQRLGLIGADTIRARFTAWYGIEDDRFWYEKRLDLAADGTPFVVEVAIAHTEIPGPVVYGLNFSPAFGDPLADTWLRGGKIEGAHGIAGFLGSAHVLPPSRLTPGMGGTPTTALVHIVSPRLTTLDRGKSRLDPSPAVAAAVGDALWRASKALYEEGERREKDAAKQQRHDQARRKEHARIVRTQQCTLKDAVFAVMEEAWAAATGNGAMEASARTIYYQARPLVQRYTTKDLVDSYFTQELLPLYQRDVRALPGLYYEARGTLYEPHTGKAVELGTREVEAYRFPLNTYDKILFIEKQGLWPPLRSALLAERYDMAIVAGEGYATEAARRLLERADTKQAYRLFVLHDADPAGYNIARTLRDETARMPGYQVEVIDLGLRFEDGLAMGLQPETFTRRKQLPGSLQLNERERQAFMGKLTANGPGRKAVWIGERIELNAMTSPQLIDYIEKGLAQYGATEKVIPPAETVEYRARISARGSLRAAAAEAIERIINTDAVIERFMASRLACEIEEKAVHAASRDVVVNALTQYRELPWTQPVQLWTSATTQGEEEAIDAAIKAMLARDE